MHVIAGKAVCFGEALDPSYRRYAAEVVANAVALGDALVDRGYRLVSGGTDNHLLLVDLRPRDAELTGAEAQRRLESAGIITNKNGIPQDSRPPMKTSGVRLGTPAVTTRGLGRDEMVQVATWIDRVLTAEDVVAVAATVQGEVAELCGRFPMPH